MTPPESMLHLWAWFWEIAQGRPVGPEGIQLAIPNIEILAWCQLSGTRLARWELVALRALDGAYLRVASEKG